jgi:hypothetical protein
MRGRGVLLHHERSRADTADGELLVALDRDPVDRHLRDARSRRALVQEGDELLDRRRGALGVNLHDRALAVAHPAHHAQLACPAERRIAKADSLHVAAHDGADRRRRGSALSIGHNTSSTLDNAQSSGQSMPYRGHRSRAGRSCAPAGGRSAIPRLGERRRPARRPRDEA